MSASLVDPATLMPRVHPQKWSGLFWRGAAGNIPAYMLKREVLLEEGWGFEELVDWEDVETRLIGWQDVHPEYAPGSQTIGQYWFGLTGYPYPFTYNRENDPVQLVWHYVQDNPSNIIDDGVWAAGISHALFLAFDRNKFTLLLASSVTTFVAQMKIAYTVANVFCLDNRGRPRIH